MLADCLRVAASSAYAMIELQTLLQYHLIVTAWIPSIMMMWKRPYS